MKHVTGNFIWMGHEKTGLSNLPRKAWKFSRRSLRVKSYQKTLKEAWVVLHEKLKLKRSVCRWQQSKSLAHKDQGGIFFSRENPSFINNPVNLSFKLLFFQNNKLLLMLEHVWNWVWQRTIVDLPQSTHHVTLFLGKTQNYWNDKIQFWVSHSATGVVGVTVWPNLCYMFHTT